MKFIFTILVVLFTTVNCYSETLNVHWGNVETTTCESGGDIVVPIGEPIAKYGYHFVGWTFLRQVEYLETTGTQYIDAGFKPNGNTRFYIDFLTTNNICKCSGYGALFGVYYDVFSFTTYVGMSGGYFDYSTTHLSPNISANKRGHISFLNNVFTDFTGKQTIVSKRNVSTDRNLYLFAEQTPGSVNPKGFFKGKIYSLQFYDWTTLSRDFIPVLDSYGIPCMYDTVENKFYYNSGTGDFIAGPIIGSTDNDTTIYNPGDIITNGCDNNDVYLYPQFEPNDYTCAPGYYLPANSVECTKCLKDHYCPGGILTFNETVSQGIEPCPEDTFAPMGSSMCYEHILHIGDDVVYLKSTKLTTPSLNVGMDDGIFYANMTTVPTPMNSATEHYLKIEYDGMIYYICDDSTYNSD